MKLHTCSYCHNPVFFENSICLTCNHCLGFNPDNISMTTLVKGKDNLLIDVSNPEKVYRYCQNFIHGTCNWIVPSQAYSSFCLACSLNRTIPSLTKIENFKSWKKIEVAKHRLIYSLLRLGLPVESKIINPQKGLVFDFMENVNNERRVITGHYNGVIIINIEEANEAARVKHKQYLGEKYRTLLGHFRHEIGHYYWDLLIKDSVALKDFREIFGDERQEYTSALDKYYFKGPQANWNNNFISPYASSHPWEDWAETWSHYLHLMDTIETAYAFGTAIKPFELNQSDMHAEIHIDPYNIEDFNIIFKMWLPLTFALNSINRSMGHDDFYPFVISQQVVKKLIFIHTLCNSKRQLKGEKA